jgi:hypothetical protein
MSFSYRGFVGVVAFGTLLTIFWSTLRVASITVFDLLSVVTLMLAAFLAPVSPHDDRRILRRIGAALLIGAIGQLLSTLAATDEITHLIKAATLTFTTAVMAALVYVVLSRRILSIESILIGFVASALCSAVVSILQGRYQILQSLIFLDPNGTGRIEEWNRMPGLAEHPIEATTTIGYGMIVLLFFRSRSANLLVVPAMAIMVYSMIYTSSFTGIIATGIGCIVILVLQRRLAVVGIVALVAPLALTAALSVSPMLSQRVSNLFTLGLEYGTVQNRSEQLSMTIERMDPFSIVTGKGYSPGDLPTDLEIHNGFVAALYHFGIFGLIGQILMIWFCLQPLLRSEKHRTKLLLLGIFIVFIANYATGPVLARRSNWLPVLFLAAIGQRYTATSEATGPDRAPDSRPLAATGRCRLGPRRSVARPIVRRSRAG